MEKRTLGNVGTRLLLENERVRVWELDLEPGARSDVHRHERGGIETAVNVGGRRYREILIELK